MLYYFIMSLPKITFLTTFLMVSSALQDLGAQNIISGSITDSKGEVVIGANISLKNSQEGSVSDIDGSFNLIATPDDTLVISYVGFSTVEQSVGQKSIFNVILSENIEWLEKIVVTGYGSQRKKDITGATSSVSVEHFNTGIMNTPEQLIQGKMAGIELIQNNGEPGAAFTVRIRGTSTIRAGNEPLYVIDGYPIDIINPSPIQNSITRQFGKNPLEFLNPEDIESIDILKDASAAAIYGARGANGVVLITTKKGQEGKPRLDYSTYVGMNTLRKKIDNLTSQEYREATSKFGYELNDFGDDTDWQDEVFRTAFFHNHDLSLSGGNRNSKYYTSIGYQNQAGIVENSRYRKFSGRIGLEQNVLNSRLKFEFNLSATRIIDERAPGNIVPRVLGQNPTWPVFDADGNYFQPQDNPMFNHPLAYLNLGEDITSTTRLLSYLSAQFEIFSDLTYKVSLGGDLSDATLKSYALPQISTANGRATISNRKFDSYLIENYLTYNRTFNNTSLTAMAGYSYQEFEEQGSILSRGDFPTADYPLVNNIGAGQELIENNSWIERNALQSFFGRIHLDYSNKYLLTANFRADGSTRFGENNKYGPFPSVAIGWRISEEPFLQNAGYLDELKIRASWGLTGNQEIPNKISQSLLGTPRDAQAIIGSTNVPVRGFAFERTPNPDLKWEETSQINVGIEASFRNGRWNVTLDYFDKRTRDFLLFALAVSSPTPAAWTNLDGEILNKGWEVALNGHLMQQGELKWETGITFTKITNEVNGLSASIPVGTVFGAGQSGVSPQIVANGSPLGAFYGRRWLGFDDDGLNKFKQDEQGNDILEEIGYAVPDVTWGWSNTLTYRNFEFSFLFLGAHGQEIFNNNALATLSKQGFVSGFNTTNQFLNSDEDFNNTLTYSSRYLEDGSYIRLKQLNLAYNFPVRNIDWVDRLQLYLNAINLWTITDYSGYDPEVNVPIPGMSEIPSIGVDWDAYPTSIGLQLGLRVSFL